MSSRRLRFVEMRGHVPGPASAKRSATDGWEPDRWAGLTTCPCHVETLAESSGFWYAERDGDFLVLQENPTLLLMTP